MYKAETIEKTQKILDLLVENPNYTNEQLRDITGLRMSQVRHAIRRLKIHNNIKTEKKDHDYQYVRELEVLDPVFGGKEDVK